MAGSEVRLGLVTVTFNSRDVLDGFFSSLRVQTFKDWHLYIVDNHSTDGGLEQVLPKYGLEGFVTIVRNETNLGFAAATNQGVRLAARDGCSHFLVINNDVEFDGALLSGLLETAVRLDAQILAPKILYADPSDVIWYAGGRILPWRGYICEHYGMGEIDRGQYDRECEVDFASGCCLLIEREVVAQIGLFDTNFFVYFEDLDFCYRANKSKIKIWFTPYVRLYHKVSSLTGTGSDFSIFQGTRGQAYFLHKHFPHAHVFWCIAMQAKLLFKFVRAMIGAGSPVRQWRLEQRAVRDGFSAKFITKLQQL
jgi:GT2 family glycosyltransferase